MEPPPKVLGHNGRVLEFVTLDSTVNRTSRVLLDAGPDDPAPVAALAICQGLDAGHEGELYLYFCTDDWTVDRLQIWNAPIGPAAGSTQEVRSHAESLFVGLESRWTQVGTFEPPAAARKSRARMRWWEYWRTRD